MSESMLPEIREQRYKAALDYALSTISKCMINDDCFHCRNREFTFEALNCLRHEVSEYKQVAEENAQIANNRAAIIVNLKIALKEALYHAFEYNDGCLYCGEGEIVDGDIADEHRLVCWYYKAKSLL